MGGSESNNGCTGVVVPRHVQPDQLVHLPLGELVRLLLVCKFFRIAWWISKAYRARRIREKAWKRASGDRFALDFPEIPRAPVWIQWQITGMKLVIPVLDRYMERGASGGLQGV